MTNTMNEKPQVFASNELMGATLTANLSKSDVRAFRADPKSFIYSALDADVGDISLSVVENGVDTINLALPYYADLERHSAEVMKDSDIANISGGEVIVLFFLISTAVGVSALVGAGAGVEAANGRYLDGSPK